MNKWATSKSKQVSTKTLVKLLLLEVMVNNIMHAYKLRKWHTK